MVDRRQIRAKLVRLLSAREEIQFAYVFGSFIEPGVPFRDVDVGLFLEPSYAERVDRFAYEASLGLELSRRIGVQIDVHVINRTPIAFTHSVLQGKKLFARDEVALSDFIERISQEWCDFEPLFRESLRDFVRWKSQE